MEMSNPIVNVNGNDSKIYIFTDKNLSFSILELFEIGQLTM